MNTTQNIRYLHKKLEDVSRNVYCLKQYLKNNPGGGSSYTQGVGVLINNNEISAKVDGTTITTNTSGQLVAIGGSEYVLPTATNIVKGGVRVDNKSTIMQGEVIKSQVIDMNSNTIAIKHWIGTQVQYDAITTKDSSTIYVIRS